MGADVSDRRITTVLDVDSADGTSKPEKHITVSPCFLLLFSGADGVICYICAGSSEPERSIPYFHPIIEPSNPSAKL